MSVCIDVTADYIMMWELVGYFNQALEQHMEADYENCHWLSESEAHNVLEDLRHEIEAIKDKLGITSKLQEYYF